MHNSTVTAPRINFNFDRFIGVTLSGPTRLACIGTSNAPVIVPPFATEGLAREWLRARACEWCSRNTVNECTVYMLSDVAR